MLEIEDYDSYYSYIETLRRKGFRSGFREGMCEVNYRLFKYDTPSEAKRFLGEDVYAELERFQNRYGSLPEKKVVEHILQESEFLIGVHI